jgi:hypothetical protein
LVSQDQALFSESFCFRSTVDSRGNNKSSCCTCIAAAQRVFARNAGYGWFDRGIPGHRPQKRDMIFAFAAQGKKSKEILDE